MGQIALTIGGAVVGNMILPGIGGAIGGALGSAAGAYLFRPDVDQPRPNDVRVMVASYGTFKTLTWGTIRVPAILIDASRQLTWHEGDSGGKGGNNAPTPGSFSIDMLDAFFSMSPNGDRTVERLFFNKRLVGDYRQDELTDGDLPVVFYDGNADQLPDPTEEAFYGAGMVPAYRRRLRGVFTGLPLADTGNAIPQIEGVVAQARPGIEGPVRTLIFVDGDEAYSWPVEDPSDTPSHPAITSWGGSVIRVRARNAATVKTYSAADLTYIGEDGLTAIDDYPTDQNSGSLGGVKSYPIGIYRYADGSTTPLWTCNGGGIHTSGNVRPIITDVQYNLSGIGSNWAEAAGLPLGYQRLHFALSQDGKKLLVIMNDNITAATHWYRIVDGVVEASGPVPYPNGGLGSGFGAVGGSITSLLQPYAMSLENDGRHLWFWAANVQTMTVYYINDAGELRFDTVAGFIDLPPSTHAVTCVAGIATLSREGCCGAVWDDSFVLLTRWLPGAGEPLRLSEIVADLHGYCGDAPEVYDVSELIDIVRGFAIYQPTTGRSAIESLMPIFAFGVRDHQGVTQYVKPGKPSIITFADSDLCGHDENGNAIPAPLQVVTGNDLEQPQKIWLKFMNPATDYQMDVVPWSRQDTASTRVETMETAVVLSKTEAKRVVDMIGQRFLNEADKYTWFTTRRKYVRYEAEDVCTVKGIDLRILKKTEQMATGIIKWEGVRSHPGVVVQTGAGGGTDDGFIPPEIPIPQQTNLLLLDIPMPGTGGAGGPLDAPYYAAMNGALRRSWKGASLRKSIDGGANYDEVASSNNPDTFGVTSTVLADWTGGNVFDEHNVVTVTLNAGSGTLSGYTRTAVLNGAGLYLVGNELLYAIDADLIAPGVYILSRLLRGRHGTDERVTLNAMGTHVIGERFVVLPAHTEIPSIFAEYNALRKYKAVTFGNTLASAAVVDFTNTGRARKPLSPVHLRGGRNAAGDIYIEFKPRTRAGDIWIDGTDAPIAEVSERYRVPVYTDNTYSDIGLLPVYTYDPDTLAHIPLSGPLTVPRCVFTAAQQIAEWGSVRSPGNAFVGASQLGELPGYETRAAI